MQVVLHTLSRCSSAALVLFVAATLARAGSIVVNSGADTIAADEYLTLREALALSDGTLTVGQLSAQEQAQVTGPVGATIADSITFVFWGYRIQTSGLQVSDGNTTIDGDFDDDGSRDAWVDAGGAVALVLASPGNVVQDIRISSTAAGILLQQGAASHSTIRHCSFDGPAILNDASSGALTDVYVYDNSMKPSNPSETAVSLVGHSGSLDNVLLVSNWMDGYELGIDLHASGTCTVSNVSLSGNTIRGAPAPLFSRGIVVASDGGTALTFDVRLEGNVVTGQVRGIEINGPGTQRVTATRNNVFDNDSVPIQLNAGANGGILPPTITSVGTTFTGTVDASVPDGSTVELFYDFDASCEPQAYRGSTTTAGGAWSLTVSTPPEGTVTATVTDPSGNTSAVGGCMSNCTPSKQARNNLIPPFNPDVLTCTVPVSPSFWVAEVTHAAGPASFAVLQVRSSSILADGRPAPAPVIYRKLCGAAVLASIVMVPDAIAPISPDQRNCTIAIPPGLHCLQFCAQAVTGGNGVVALSNAIDGSL